GEVSAADVDHRGELLGSRTPGDDVDQVDEHLRRDVVNDVPAPVLEDVGGRGAASSAHAGQEHELPVILTGAVVPRDGAGRRPWGSRGHGRVRIEIGHDRSPQSTTSPVARLTPWAGVSSLVSLAWMTAAIDGPIPGTSVSSSTDA